MEFQRNLRHLYQNFSLCASKVRLKYIHSDIVQRYEHYAQFLNAYYELLLLLCVTSYFTLPSSTNLFSEFILFASFPVISGYNFKSKD